MPIPASFDGDALAAWLRLDGIRGIGPETARKLLAAFGLPGNIFAAGFAALREVVSERIAASLLTPLDEPAQTAIDRTLAWAQQANHRLLTLADADYPQKLLEIPDPPLLLYAVGDTTLLNRASLAVVGSRNATTQGIQNAEKFSQTLSEAGITIISGMALGIDTAAHTGALSPVENGRSGGSTIAVIGTGADIVYPARNRALAHRIAQYGCLLSEYPLGTPAIASNFPRRNRIISGLARGVLVVEAAAQSGSLITARMAAEQGRDVFAIPGSIHSPLAKGCHLLIKQGAKLVESAQDIFEEYRDLPAAAPAAEEDDASSADQSDDALFNAIGYDPIHVETLMQRLGLDAAGMHALLLTYELDGKIERLPGEWYRRLR